MQIYSLRFPVVEVTPFTSGNYDLHVTPWGNKKRVWEIPPQSALTNIYWWVNPINTAATGFSICWIDQIYECSESALPTVTATLGARWATSSGNKREIVYLAKNGKPWDSNWNLMQTLRRLFFVGHHCANGGRCNNVWAQQRQGLTCSILEHFGGRLVPTTSYMIQSSFISVLLPR